MVFEECVETVWARVNTTGGTETAPFVRRRFCRRAG